MKNFASNFETFYNELYGEKIEVTGIAIHEDNKIYFRVNECETDNRLFTFEASYNPDTMNITKVESYVASNNISNEYLPMVNYLSKISVKDFYQAFFSLDYNGYFFENNFKFNKNNVRNIKFVY